MTGYEWRKSAFEKTPRTLALDDTGITETRKTGSTRIDFADLRGIRVTYAPTRFKLNRHLLTLTGRGGKMIQVENTTFEGMGQFADQSESFTGFVTALLDALRQHRPDLRLAVGAPPGSYLLQLGFVLVVFLVLTAVVLALPISGASWTSFAKLGIIIVFLPFLFRWALKARPRKYSLGDLPEDLLPAA